MKPNLTSVVKAVRRTFVHSRTKTGSLSSRAKEMDLVVALGQPACQIHGSIFNAAKIANNRVDAKNLHPKINYSRICCISLARDMPEAVCALSLLHVPLCLCHL
jgi:hypothetical protein